MAGWSAREYEAALREAVGASERERQLIEAAGRSETIDRAMIDARGALARLGYESLLRPVEPVAVQGDIRSLQQRRAAQERRATQAVASIVAEIDRLEEGRDADAHRQEVRQDLLWRVPVPLVAGLAAFGLLSGGSLALAVVVATIVSTLAIGLTGAYVVRRLRAEPGRPGLADQDVALACGGAFGTLFGLLAAALPGAGAARLAALLFAAVAAYTAARRLSVWRAART